jgi:hypothetical protein
VLGIHRHALTHRVRPADLLKPRRDLGVVQIGMIAATWADKLKYVGVAAFYPAVRDADRLAPQARSLAMTRLASTRQRQGALGVHARPRITGIVLAASCRDGSAAGTPPRTGDSVRVCRASHRITRARRAGARHVLAGFQPQMLRVGRKARLQDVWPADLLQPRWNLGEIHIGMIAAGAADDLVHAGVAGFALLRHPDQLAPQAQCLARSGLPSKRQRPHILGVNAHPRVPAMTLFARCGDGARTSARPGTGPAVRISCTAHSTHPRGGGHVTAGDWSSTNVCPHDTHGHWRSKEFSRAERASVKRSSEFHCPYFALNGPRSPAVPWPLHRMPQYRCALGSGNLKHAVEE